MKRRMVCLMLAVAAMSSMPVSPVATASTYAPTGVSNLIGSAVTGQPRRVTLSFNAPGNANLSGIAGYTIQYRCIAEAGISSDPCTGSWRGLDTYEPTGTTTNNQLVTVSYTLAAGIAGANGRPVSFRVQPIGSGDAGLLGPMSSATVINVFDTPVMRIVTSSTSPAPINTRSSGVGRITVTLTDPAITQTRGSTVTQYLVRYTRNNSSWFDVPITGGWDPGDSSVLTGLQSGVAYYFKLTIKSNAGDVVQPGVRQQNTA